MSIHIDTVRDKQGMWAFSVSAGETNDLDEYAGSDFEFDTEDDAEMAALRWIVDAWHVM